MKRLLSLILALLLVPCLAHADFSGASDVYDPSLAQWALQIAELCSTPEMQKGILQIDGFQMLGEYNYRRPAGDTRHVAAYTVFDRMSEDGRTSVIISIRGTGNEEWPLNLELMPSGNYDHNEAENFALAAEDILTTHAAYLDGLVSPEFLITGHSRGAAVANILGARLNDRFGAENVFVYTFATPRTVRGDHPAYGNIFNIINPADVITYVPLPQWGFERYGVDLILPIDDPDMQAAAQTAYRTRADQSRPFSTPEGGSAAAEALVSAMADLVPNLSEDYNIRHALAHPGAAEPEEDGMTAAEFLLLFVNGELFSNDQPTAAMRRLMQAENDFTPLLAGIRSQPEMNNAMVSLLMQHLPGIYGAWMTAALE